MRILFPILARFPGPGASIVQVANMAQAFAELGHDVVLLAPAGPPDLARDGGAASERDFGFRPTFEVRTLSSGVHRGQSYLHALRTGRIAAEGPFNLVFSRNLRSAAITALRGIPTVVEVHTLNSLTGPQDRMFGRLLRTAPGFRGIVAISHGLADDLTRIVGIKDESVLVAHDAVRPEDGRAAERAAAPPGTVSVGYTGSMFPGRGIEQLITVVEQDPRVALHLVGGPSDAAERWAADAPRAVAEGRLHVHGPVSPARARELQRGFDMLAAPFARRVSTDSGVDSSRWMSPMKVFEYMDSGRPMVISDLPVLREVLRPGVDALMVPPEDVGALAAAIGRLADDPDLGRRLAASARERVRREFTWRTRATRILDRFMADRAPGPPADRE